ncbi:hypothetical protein [Nocardia otitidiscaviarum]|uniref:hypothetical protein n=1 Tax=Nocardia otitidiscaviarum TaxID=1823 RepID=UPI0011DE23CC|nr:hypothetical protein [Nocardia otitidiscaviarum]
MSAQRYIKKPVVIEAMHFETTRLASAIADWCGGNNDARPDQIQIPTLEGVMTANVGDWVIRGVKGEFYPCRDDIFRETYEQVAGL